MKNPINQHADPPLIIPGAENPTPEQPPDTKRFRQMNSNAIEFPSSSKDKHFDINVIRASLDIERVGVITLNIPQETLLTLFANFYEVDESRFITCVYTKTDRLLELGSGIGYMTSILGRLADKVISLEPMEKFAAVAQNNVAANDLPNVSVIPVMGDVRNGKTIFNQRLIAYGSSVLPDRPGYAVDEGQQILVDCMDINMLIASNSLNAIHMDAEGYEYVLLSYLLGAGGLNQINKLTFEVHTHVISKQSIYSLFLNLMDAGLRFVGISGIDKYPKAPYVVCFVREEVINQLSIIEGNGMHWLQSPDEAMEIMRKWAEE